MVYNMTDTILIETINFLKNRKLKAAINKLSGYTKDNNLGEYASALQSIETSYSALLKFFINGGKDQDREKVLKALKDDILALALRIFNRAAYNRQDTLRAITQKNSLPDIQKIENLIGQENIRWSPELIETFLNYTLIFSELKQWNSRLFTDFLTANEVPEYIKGQWVALFTINGLKEFQKEKLLFLADLLPTEEALLSARALTGIFLIMLYHDHLMEFYTEEVASKIAPLIDDNEIISLVSQFIRSQDTERIEQRINNDVLPEILDHNDFIREKLNNPEDEGMDENPDWEEIFSETPEFMEKLQEISEMQLEGNDTFLSAFRHLKHFPFFEKVSNWLLPFSTRHPALEDLERESPELKELLFDKMEKSFHICNSDKYSLLFNLTRMPEAQKKMVIKMLQAEMSGVETIAKDRSILDADAHKKHLITQYMQDLYRFFELSPWKNEFVNIFKTDISLYKTVFAKIFLSQNPGNRAIVELFFANKDFANVVDGLKLMQSPAGQETFEKLAYAYQQLGNYDKAIENYRKAELYDSQSTWNQKKIAYCLKKKQLPGEALKIYLQIEPLEAGNIRLLSSIAYTYIELNEFEKALDYFHRIQELGDYANTYRPISWCYFNLKKINEAKENLYNIELQDFTKHDYLNIGHLELISGNIRLAHKFYLKSLALFKDGFTSFDKSFDKDIPILLANGLPLEDIRLIRESLIL